MSHGAYITIDGLKSASLSSICWPKHDQNRVIVSGCKLSRSKSMARLRNGTG